MPVGQNQEAAAVGDELEAAILGGEIPANPAITNAALESRRRDAHKCYPLVVPGGHVPERLANFCQIAKVVMPCHLFFVAWLFMSLYGANLEL